MDRYEAITHSFIVKLWLEDKDGKGSQITWHGHITHVPSGERRYLKDLDAIPAFIAPYLEVSGVENAPKWQVAKWLNRSKRYLTRRS